MISQHKYLLDQQLESTTSYLQSNERKISTDNQMRQEEIKNIASINHKLKNRDGIENLQQGSYLAVLQQSLTTQDKAFIYEILLDDGAPIIHNTLKDLSPAKVIELLKIIKNLLENNLKYGKGQDNWASILKWLQQLLKTHLSVIVSSAENKAVVESIKKLLQKRAHQQQKLLEIRSMVVTPTPNGLNTQKIYRPKFEYVQEEKIYIQEEEKHENMEEQGEIDAEGDFDEELAEFYDEDF